MLEKFIHIYIDELNRIIGLHELRCSSKYDSSHKRYIIFGILRVNLSLQEGLCRTTLMHAFNQTGIYPFNIDQMIRNCKIEVPNVERLHWLEQLEAAKAVMMETGELQDAFLDQLNIGNNMLTNKDKLCLSRRRMVILTKRNLFLTESFKYQEKKRLELLKNNAKGNKNLKRKIVNATPKKVTKRSRLIQSPPNQTNDSHHPDEDDEGSPIDLTQVRQIYNL